MKTYLMIKSSGILIFSSLFLNEKAFANEVNNVKLPINQMNTVVNDLSGQPKTINFILESNKATDNQTNVSNVQFSDAKQTLDVMTVLNNLSYVSIFRNYVQNQTIYDWSQNINQYLVRDPGSFWGVGIDVQLKNAIINTIKKQKDIYDNMVVVNVDGTESTGALKDVISDKIYPAKSYKFTITHGKDLIILFAGTSGDAEWYDDGVGGLEADTRSNKIALAYYDQQVEKYDGLDKNIYVTGQSKGGNKSMYVGILRGQQVKAVYSYDGEGFGQTFLEKYSTQIKKYRSKITNISSEEDFVNFLFHPIAGTTKYVKQQIGWRMADIVIPDAKITDLKSFISVIGAHLGIRLLAGHVPSNLLTIKSNGEVTTSDFVEQNPLIKVMAEIEKYGVDNLPLDQLKAIIQVILSSFMVDPAHYYIQPMNYFTLEKAIINVASGFIINQANIQMTIQVIDGIISFINKR